MKLGPDFIGIGAQKSGTTWLDAVLRAHPETWLPPVKELHFFDEFYCSEPNLGLKRYLSQNGWVRARWRRNFTAVSKFAARYPSASNLKWAVRYLLRPLSYDWYQGLFSVVDKVAGEITPAYCTLCPSQVAELARHFPQVKAIVLVRNPIERAWSHCRMELFWRHGFDASQVEESEIRNFLFKDQNVLARSNYSQIIQTWQQVLGHNQVFVGLYDEISSNPVAFARRIFSFLGITPDYSGLDCVASSRKFEGKSIEMPEGVRRDLNNFYSKEIQRLDEMMPQFLLAELWSFARQVEIGLPEYWGLDPSE